MKLSIQIILALCMLPIAKHNHSGRPLISDIYTFTEIKCPATTAMYGSLTPPGDVDFGDNLTLECENGFGIDGSNMTTKVYTCGDDSIFEPMIDMCKSMLYH